MQALVTGATGFIGSNLVRHLLERGDEVRVLKRSLTDPAALAGLPVEIVEGNITDASDVERAARGVEGIYHVAALVSYWPPKQKQQWEVNVAGTRHVVAAAVRSGARRIVHTSTITALGFHSGGTPSDEDTPWQGEPYGNGYCETKYVGEREALLGIAHGLEVVVVNPALAFGRGDFNLNAARIFRMVDGHSTVLAVDGQTTTCDVDDVCAGHIGAMHAGRSGQRYVLGGEARRIPTLIAEAADVMGQTVRIRTVPYIVAQGMAHAALGVSRIKRKEPFITPELVWLTTRRRVYSSQRAISELGYPQTPLRVSLEKGWRWYRDYRSTR